MPKNGVQTYAKSLFYQNKERLDNALYLAKMEFIEYFSNMEVRLRTLLLFTGMMLGTFSNAQPVLERVDTIKVIEGLQTLENPWAGGLNFCQFSEIDLNLDGKKDLFVFDRTGNVIRTFINQGTFGTIKYVHAPEFENKFPEVYEWALLKDYNCDNKADLYCYSSAGGGLDVYMNTSTLAGGLSFQLVATKVISKQFNFNIPIYVSGVDIPAPIDVDNDGDIDILTFHSAGTIVEYHKNLSMETYGVCDSLNKFEMRNQCFGYFSEGFSSNKVTLDDTCGVNVANPEGVGSGSSNPTPQHSGSTVFAFDVDGDGVKELALGDIAFPNMVYLKNGGTVTANKMISQDTAFPSNTTSVNMTLFPAAFGVDVNNDGKQDMLVSPAAPNISENFNSVWYYQNNGTGGNTVFIHQQNNFLQDGMIEVGEGNYPAFFDYNKDGKLDIVIGNQGYFNPGGGYDSKLALYENTGTPNNPQFTLITRDYHNLSSLALNGLTPTFGDLDGDGDEDMIIGESTGVIHYFKDTSTTGSAKFLLFGVNYSGIDVGNFSAPQLFDINGDTLLDLIIGEQGDNLNYFENVGSLTSPSFSPTPTSTTLGNVKVNKPYITGFTAPFLFKHSGKTHLVCGSESGYISVYDSIEGNLTGSFYLIDSMYLNTHFGFRSSPAMADINNDGMIDAVVGNYAGGLSIFLGTSGVFGVNDITNFGNDIKLYPNPVGDLLQIELGKMYNQVQINVYNIIGTRVWQRQYDLVRGLQINTNEFKPGVYLLQLEINGNRITKKFVVE